VRDEEIILNLRQSVRLAKLSEQRWPSQLYPDSLKGLTAPLRFPKIQIVKQYLLHHSKLAQNLRWLFATSFHRHLAVFLLIKTGFGYLGRSPPEAPVITSPLFKLECQLNSLEICNPFFHPLSATNNPRTVVVESPTETIGILKFSTSCAPMCQKC